MRYAVIMAGGSGKRLWPLSRRNHPKQVLRLINGKSLMEVAVQRLEGEFEPEQILIIANSDYADEIAEALPEIPRENIISEPEGRDTANAIALAAAIVAGKDDTATIAVFTADHIIRPIKCFAKAVSIAMNAAETNPGATVTFGVLPSWPHTGLGYIQAGPKVSEDVRRVASFQEKPDHTTARQYVESREYFWNSGMFVWTSQTINDALKQHLPDSFAKLQPVTEAVSKGEDYTGILAEVYPTLKKISIDYAVMEKAEHVLMVELKCEWIDLGSWPALEDVVDSDDQGNAIIAGNHVAMDSFRNILVSSEEDHLLAVMGIDDCIVIHSPDATLVCKKSDNQRLKELVAAIGKHYDGKYL